MIGAVIAMQSEAEILLSQMKITRSLAVSGKTVHVGKAYGKDVALCVCGVGKVNAALGTQLVVSKFDAEKLLNFGVSGGLNADTELCQVYQIEGATQFDFDLAQLNGTSIGTLASQGQTAMTSAPHAMLFPAIFLSLLLISFNLFGNGLRDAFNPATRGVDG